MTLQHLRRIAEFHDAQATKARASAEALESYPLPTEQLAQEKLIRHWRSEETFHSHAARELTALADQIPTGVTLTNPITHQPLISQ